MAKRFLWTTIREHISGTRGSDAWGMADYARSLQEEDPAAASRQLGAVVAELKTNFPDVYPFLLAAAVANEPDPHAPLIAEFEASITNRIDEMKKKKFVVTYFSVLGAVVRWAVSHTNYDLASKVLKVKLEQDNPTDQDDRMNLAYAYEATRQWQAALAIFETYSNRPIQMGNSGFYGKGSTLIFPHHHCEHCRTNLGLPVIRDPREFSLARPRGLWFHSYLSFTTDTDGLWVGAEGKLFRLNYDLTTNFTVNLPGATQSGIFAITATPETIWLGTSRSAGRGGLARGGWSQLVSF